MAESETGHPHVWRAKKILITGGGGYFGMRFARKLLQLGAGSVRLFDLRCPEVPFNELKKEFGDRTSFIQGDVRDTTAIQNAVTGTDLVYHVASFGMSGGDMLKENLANEINVGGTKNIVQGALQSMQNSDRPAAAVIFTSSCNVIFDGVTPLLGVDETYPYPPLEGYMDAYSKTKRLAEEVILKANGSEIPSAHNGVQTHLATCSLRSTGIYGEGEERHFGRLIKTLRQGLCVFTVGDPNTKIEWVYIDNLIDAHLLAGEKLLTEGIKSKIAGKSYFISDWEPVNQWEFFRPLIEALGYTFPKLRVPTSLLFFAARISEYLYTSWIGKTFPHQIFLTRMEVAKIVCPHYFSTERAQKELGYKPRVTMSEGLKRVIAYYCPLEEEYRRKQAANSSLTPSTFIKLALLGLVIAFVMYFLS